jgi:primary-amine oxidase
MPSTTSGGCGRGFLVYIAAAAMLLLAACRPAATPASRDATPAPAAPTLPASTAAAAAPHPLDPLSGAEIETAAKIIRQAPQFPGSGMFSTIVLHEPPKSDVLAFKPGAGFTRQAFSIVLDRRANRTFEAVVDLRAGSVLSWNEVQGVQPPLLDGEYAELSRIVKEDAAWQAAMRKRSITDFSTVQVDGWAVGQVAPIDSRTSNGAQGKPASPAARLMRAVTYLVAGQTNFYGRPVEGVVALVNMNTGRVVEVVDTGAVPMPPPSQEFDEKSTGVRTAPKRLAITQPNGASFTINGHEIRWQKWRFRYALHPREGLVLHTVGYEDGDRVRPVLYRAALSEMVVPYGDADQNWRWRAAFDVGEYNVGRLASSIEPNTDAPENAALLDATFADDEGKPVTLPRAVGIYERDGGLLWKHYDMYSKQNQSRRARQLVVFFIATIGNYDYGINWIFHQDGTIEVDAALSGIMLPKGVKETKVAGHSGVFPSGHLVSANVVAPHHQHFFNFRLDLDVDGPENSVHEMNTRAGAPGRDNPALNAMVMEETELASERRAPRRMDLSSARHWLVVNPSAQNALGHHTSYILVPGPNALPYVAATSPLRQRAGFINNHFWATRFKPGELNAAGPYPNQSTGGDGLPRWTADDEPLLKQDVVVWYTFGITHIPRPEEWPIMPATHVGFRLIPGGFFSRNPALDVPACRTPSDCP